MYTSKIVITFKDCVFFEAFSQVSIVSHFQLLFFPCWVQSPNGRISLVETLQETEVLTNAKATVGIQKFCGRHPLPLCHRLLVVVVGISFEYIFVVKKYFSDHSRGARERVKPICYTGLYIPIQLLTYIPFFTVENSKLELYRAWIGLKCNRKVPAKDTKRYQGSKRHQRVPKDAKCMVPKGSKATQSIKD